MSRLCCPALVVLLASVGQPARAAAPTQPAQPAPPLLWSTAGSTIRGVGGNYVVETAAGASRFALPAGVEIEELYPLRQQVFLSARGGEDRAALFLALADGSGLHPLPVPERESGRASENAVPLPSARGDLEGLVWLEGADRQSYAIRYAAWNGLAWSQPTEVAASAPGSQLALAAARLADGSRILVWSRFDGEDDEIYTARFVDGRWSPPQALAADNAVPDITPAVVAAGAGALATWSRYDGHEYRLVMSRFDGERWSSPAWVGPAGATDPALTREATAGGEVWLTFASAHPRGWGVLALDTQGHLLRQGSIATAETARPALAARPGGAVQLRWPGSERDLPLE